MSGIRVGRLYPLGRSENREWPWGIEQFTSILGGYPMNRSPKLVDHSNCNTLMVQVEDVEVQDRSLVLEIPRLFVKLPR